MFNASLAKPMVRYYNSNFLSGYDMVYKNTIHNFNDILKVNSSYITESLDQIKSKPNNTQQNNQNNPNDLYIFK